jgi:hypothetical protein
MEGKNGYPERRTFLMRKGRIRNTERNVYNKTSLRFLFLSKKTAAYKLSRSSGKLIMRTVNKYSGHKSHSIENIMPPSFLTCHWLINKTTVRNVVMKS